ncbi:MAG: hypothetical protein LBT20_07860 [Clostridiales bacterium]|jgi:hypothetical protein|nr:hypothetical protein [Clostridiales bacterium]
MGMIENEEKVLAAAIEEDPNAAMFDWSAPLCHICKNRIKREWDRLNPFAPISACKKLGEVPSDIHEIKTLKCKEFELSSEEWKRQSGFYPKDFNPIEAGK